MSNRAALEVVLATIALHLIAAPGAGTGPMMVAPAAARSANAPGRATDSSGTLAGVLLGQEDGQPVPYGTVLIIGTDESQFTDADGRFRLAGSPRQIHGSRAPDRLRTNRYDGSHRFRTGGDYHHPTDDPPSSATRRREGRRPPAEGVRDDRSTRFGDGPGTGCDIAQVEENVARFRLLWDEYPFHYTRDRVVLLRLDPGGSTVQRTETATYESRSHQSYRPGEVVHDETDASGQLHRLMYLPTFRDLADTIFLAAHCFSLGGVRTSGG